MGSSINNKELDARRGRPSASGLRRAADGHDSPRRLLDPRERWTDEEWDVREQMSGLAEGFPSVAGKPGVKPWDAEQLERWAMQAGLSGTQQYCVRFLLHVWDGERQWRCGRFDLLNALDHWDPAHRAAFASWIVDPWWPLSLRTDQSSAQAARAGRR